MVDTVQLMDFESGNLNEIEIIELIAEMVSIGEIDNYDDKFSKLAKKFKRLELIDDEGNINYIKVKEYAV